MQEYFQERWEGVSKLIKNGKFPLLKKFKKGLPEYDNKYGEPVSDKDNYLKLYEKSLKELTSVLKKAFPGCELYDEDKDYNEKQYNGVNVIDIFQPVIHLGKNFEILKDVDKKGLIKDYDSLDDVDGEDMCSFLEDKVFKKLSNFKETEGTYGMYYHKSFEELAIFCDEDFERISISINIPYKVDNE